MSSAYIGPTFKGRVSATIVDGSNSLKKKKKRTEPSPLDNTFYTSTGAQTTGYLSGFADPCYGL